MKAALPLSPLFIEAHESKLSHLLDHFEKSGSLHSTLLFTGAEGVGKKSFALHFVQTLFCDQSIFNPTSPNESSRRGRAPCGSCKSCKQALANQWLDLFWFDPESNDEETRLGTHRIDSFRELKGKLGLGPLEEPYKIVVIADADRMTPAAANSILKMLEEPPQNWIFILTASDSSRLLPTILSRCMEIRLNPIPADRILSILKSTKGSEFNSSRAQVASRAANGSITRALQFSGEETWELRDRLLGLLTNPSHEWMKLIDLISKTQFNVHLCLDLLESIFSDLLQERIRGSAHAWTHLDQKEFLIQFADARNLDATRLCTLLESISEKRKWAGLTLNGKLLAQEILIPILGVL